MANEHVQVFMEGAHGNHIIPYQVSGSTTAVEKGALLGLFVDRTVSGSSTVGEACAGIAAREVIASDGRDQVGVHKKGYFRGAISGSVAIGAPLMSAGHENYLKGANTVVSGSQIIGYAEQTAAATSTSFLWRLDL